MYFCFLFDCMSFIEYILKKKLVVEDTYTTNYSFYTDAKPRWVVHGKQTFYNWWPEWAQTNLGLLIEGAGVPMSHVDLTKMAMPHVCVAYFPPCHMSNWRNSQVSCHYLFLPQWHMSLRLMSQKSPCRRVKFRSQGPLTCIGGLHTLLDQSPYTRYT